MKFSLQLAERRALLVAVDLFLINVAVLFALWVAAVRGPYVFDRSYLLARLGWFPFLSAFWLLSAWLNDFYKLDVASTFLATGQALFRTVALIFIAYLLVYFGSYPEPLQRGIVVWHGATSLLLVSLWRGIYVWLVRRSAFSRCVLIVGAGWAGQTIARTIRENLSSDYAVVGLVDDDAGKKGECVEGFPILGTCRDLVPLVKRHGVAEVVLAITDNLPGELFQALLDCKALGIQLTPMPVLYEQLTGRVPTQHIGENWYVALPLDHPGAGGFYTIGKRIFDILTASLGLALFALVLPFVALAIVLESGRPVFYTQERVGQGGKLFHLIKLRTMKQDAEKDGHAVRAQVRDPRVTRVGKWLRKTRLDEFPQLVNVLHGEMSAVGPRPERPEHLAELEREIPFHQLRHAVKPGMAGWAAVQYDYVETVNDARVRFEYDLYYIKHQSISLDLLILIRMVGNVFALRGR